MFFSQSNRKRYWYGSCDCIDGYYEEDEECKKCELPCTKCTAIDTCTTIYDCEKDISGLYPDTGNLKCEKCPYPCKRCEDGSGCTVCGYGPDNRESAPSCRCKDGFFD